MEYASRVTEIINAFSPEPLKGEQMQRFYYSDTMEYRMSDKYSSPMEDIFDICRQPGEQNAILLLSHRGGGKTTELNWMSEKLRVNGYQVKTIACSMDLDLFNIVYSDLFILMGEALLKIAEELECSIDQDILTDIMEFWEEGTEIKTSQKRQALSAETGVSAETPKFLKNILKAFAKIRADLKFNEEIRTEYRKKVSVRSSEWIQMLSYVSKKISQKTAGKSPIIIFEDLDKLSTVDAWKIFYNYGAILSGMPFPVIYTFPIGLSYDPKFSVMESYFIAKTLPMIKVETLDGQSSNGGIKAIEKIVEKRADLSLFESGVLESLIKYTGGSLRDLFQAINAAAKRAERRESHTICGEDADRALEELKSSLTRRIEKKDYDFLINIYRGNKKLIEDKEILLKMLQASVVLEYNGKRWHNIHPLIAKFLGEQGLITNVGA